MLQKFKFLGERHNVMYTEGRVAVIMACPQCRAWAIFDDLKPNTAPKTFCVQCTRDSGHDVNMEPAAVIEYSKEGGLVTEYLIPA